MSEKPKLIETRISTKASKKLQEEVRAELSVEETEQSAARLKEILQDDCNETRV